MLKRLSSSDLKSAPAPPPFSEARVWSAIGGGWRPLFARFHELGFSFEWHDYWSAGEVDWASTFHPQSLELCLNLEGAAWLQAAAHRVELPARWCTFYYQGKPPLEAERAHRQKHRFFTVEFSRAFLKENFAGHGEELHTLVRDVMEDKTSSGIAPAERIGTSLLQLVESLQHCPVFKGAQELWFRAKALELAAQLFFRPAAGELFCTRAQRAARERVERARGLLKEMMREPPSLEELGRLVGCSPFYLSRQFSDETGLTIQQYIRQVRLEHAAELLRTGRCNVTEAALEVGYNSVSHFSTAFHEMFGCCPGLYPLKTPAQGA